MAARAKARAVDRDGKVSLCVLNEQWPLTYLQVYGDAVIDTDPDLAVEVLIKVVELMAGEEVPAERHPQLAELAAEEERVVVRIRPYATFETPPRHVHKMADIDSLSHFTSQSMPW